MKLCQLLLLTAQLNNNFVPMTKQFEYPASTISLYNPAEMFNNILQCIKILLREKHARVPALA